MSLYYRDSSGDLNRIAGLNGTSGELVPSDAYYQTGSFTVSSVAAGEYSGQAVTFDTEMPDTDYVVTLNTSASISHMIFTVTAKTVSGFSVIATNLDSSAQSCTVSWQAFKLMTDEDNLAAYTQVSQNLANLAPTFSEETDYAVGDYVTYSGLLYKCTTAHSAGTWDSSNFTATTVADIVNPSETTTTITFTNGDTGTMGFTRIGKLVSCYLLKVTSTTGKFSTAGSWVQIGTVPDGYYPAANQITRLLTGSESRILIQILITGEIKYYNMDTTIEEGYESAVSVTYRGA